MLDHREEKKKPNIILYTLLMIVVFFVITELFIWGYGSSILIYSIQNFPQGSLVISEAVLSALVLIVMLRFGNSYVFSQKKENFFKGLFLGAYYLIGFVLFFIIYGVLYGGLFTGFTVLNLFVGALFVGIAEEFLCRGWLLNEFLERFGNTKFGVWYSIVISGIIFGLMHIGNIFTSGQSVAGTIVQVLNAAVTGIMYGIIYYKTGNIFSVIALHTLWDFSLFLADAVPVTEATVVIQSVTHTSIISSVLLVLALLINVIPYIKDIEAEPKKSLVVICAVISFVLFLFFTINSGESSTEYGDTYEYGRVEIDEYAITKDNYSMYLMECENENGKNTFALYCLNHELVFENLMTDYKVSLPYYSLYDYRIVENDDYFVLAYIDYTETCNPFLRYIYISKADVSSENSFVSGVKASMKEYLLPDTGDIVVITDREDGTQYITYYGGDVGYYLLVEEGSMARLYQ